MATHDNSPDAQDPSQDAQDNSQDEQDSAPAAQDTAREPSYDALFKLLFKHRAVMESLLRCIGALIGIPGPWIEAMVLATLQPFSTEYVTESLDPEDLLRKHFSDSTWIVVIREEYLDKTDGVTRHFAIVHECQSTRDPTMPMRMEIYPALIQVDLWRAGLTPRNEATIVISLLTNTSGDPWRTSTDTADLYPVVGGIPAGGVVGSKPHYLIDLCSMNCDDLPQDELITCLIRLRSADNWDQVWDILAKVRELAPNPEEKGILWAFYHLAKRIIKVPAGYVIPSFEEMEEWLRQGGNMTTFIDQARDAYRARVEAEHAAIRTKSLAEGREEVREESLINQREMLRRLATKCFDAETAERVAEFVSAIDDPERLAEVAELIVECETGEELLGRLV